MSFIPAYLKPPVRGEENGHREETRKSHAVLAAKLGRAKSLRQACEIGESAVSKAAARDKINEETADNHGHDIVVAFWRIARIEVIGIFGIFLLATQHPEIRWIAVVIRTLIVSVFAG